MSKSRISASEAWQWIIFGWQIFTKRPVMWVLLALAYFVCLYVLTRIPVIGSSLAALATPVLFAALLLAVREVESGQVLMPAKLVEDLGQKTRLVHLGLLGLVPLATSLLQAGLLNSGLPHGLSALLGLLLSVACACALLFGLPLVLLANKPVTESVPASLRACLEQPVVIAVFMGLAVLLLVVAMIPLGLGLLVYMPVMAGAVYASYRQVI